MQALIVSIFLLHQRSTPVDLGIAGIDDMYPQVCHMQQMCSHTMCLVWQAYQNGDWEIYSRFTEGSIWGDDDIYYSTHTGVAWQTPQPITSSAANDSLPEITCLNFTGTAVSWQTDAHGDWEIYRTATDTFTTHYRITSNAAADLEPCPLFYDVPIRQWDIPMIAFTSNRNGNDDVFSWIDWQGVEVIDEDSAQDIHPVLTANSIVYLWALWQTDRDGDWDIYGCYRYMPGSVAEQETMSGSAITSISPNPFRSNVHVSLNPPGRDKQRAIRIYNAAGQMVRTIAMTGMPGSNLSIFWDGKDQFGKTVIPGVYFVRVESDMESCQRKLIKID